MEWTEILIDLFEVCVIPLLGVATTYLVLFLKSKINALKETSKSDKVDKYLSMLSNTVENAVLATTQTYVDALKKNGSFDATAQKMAFEITYKAVMSSLTDEAKKYLAEVTTDLDQYVTEMIEAKVKTTKN